MPTKQLRAVTAAILTMAPLVFAGDAAPRSAGRLEAGGGSLAGDLEPAPEVAGGARDTLLWRSPRFASPFEFRLGDVSGIAFPAAARRPEAGPFVHLRGGDVIAATIESLDDVALVASFRGPDGPTRLRIERGEVAAISRAGDGGGSYVGPSGLAGWEQAPAEAWREEAGRIMTDRAGAAVTRDVAAAPRARYDIRLSRRRAATEFRLAVAAAERPADDGYVLQAVGGDAAGGMMLVRRGGGRAAIEPLPAVEWRGDTLRVVLFVDQEAGRLAAVLPDAPGADARRAHEVRLPPGDGVKASGRFRLELTSGDVSLERIEVTPWRGDEPSLQPADGTSIVMKAGPLEGFTVSSFDAAKGEYELARGGETRRVAAAEVEEIVFPVGDEAAAAGAIRVVGGDRTTLTGDLVKVDDRAVWVRRRGLEPVVAVPRDAIVAIRSLQAAARRPEPAGRVGTLVVGDDRMRGVLVGADGDGIAWQPLGSANAAAFAGAVDAELEYVARRPQKRPADVEVGGVGAMLDRDAEGFFVVTMMTEDGAAARDGRIASGDRIVAVSPSEKARFVETKQLDQENVTHLLRGRVGTTVRLKITDGAGANPRDVALVRGAISVAGREILELALQAHVRLAGAADVPDDPRVEYPSVVVLRSGDTAPCRIESIDADAVTLRSPLAADATEAVRVPVTLVKAVELTTTAASRTLDKTLRDRLLTLPRMQRDRPPTHLLRLVDGDYLRGRLVRVDDKVASFEVLDVVKELPRSQVARLIWLHPEMPQPEGEPAQERAEEPAADGLTVQGVTADGRRVTLVAGGVEGNVLAGSSRAFGASVIDLAKIDRLLLGGAIGRDSRELPFAQWVLKPAPEPRALGKPDER